MRSAADVDADQLRLAVWEAVRTLYDQDSSLLIERAHERSVMFHVGRRLANAVGSWQDPWQVDLDYNRASDSERLDRVKKHLPATPGRADGGVFPDLIVHHRSRSTDAANLLVLECKCDPTDRTVDYGKLRGFQEVFGYRIAAYLELPKYPEPPRLIWHDSLTAASPAFLDPGTPPPPMWSHP